MHQGTRIRPPLNLRAREANVGSFGENLRREREMRGVDLREIADATRINLRFLEAVENEEFGKLPGGVFNRGFIRSYARYLGLDEEKILGEYELASGSEVTPEWSSTSYSSAAPRRIGLKAQWLAGIAAIVMLLGGYTLFRYSESPPSSPRPQAMPVEATVTPDAADDLEESGRVRAPEPTARSEDSLTAPPTAARAATAPAPPRRRIPDTEDMILQVAVTEEAWVAIDADGATVLSRLMAPEEIRTFRSQESFDVITGNAGGIILTLNGETLGPLGGHGEVKSVRLTRQAMEPRSP